MEQQILSGALVGISGAPYQITSYGFTLLRLTDPDGAPKSAVYGGEISLSVILKADSKLLELMINHQTKPIRDGQILIKSGEAKEAFQTIDFTDGYITSYVQNIDLIGDAAPTCSFKISAASIRIGQAILKRGQTV